MEISGDQPDPMQDWLKDVSFVLENQSSKTVVAVGISVVLPARQPNADCHVGIPTALDPFCAANPGWCDNGCAALIHEPVHWGLIPAPAASGLLSRYKAEAKGLYGDRAMVEGKESFQLFPGAQINLSPAGRAYGLGAIGEPRHGFADSINGILYEEGIEEAKGEKPCAERANSKTGCGFAEVSKFNIGVDVVYFDDGMIWGNYGYGYAIPNPDGIFTRVNVHDSPPLVDQGSARN
jgi:hypothetical protein